MRYVFIKNQRKNQVIRKCENVNNTYFQAKIILNKKNKYQ